MQKIKPAIHRNTRDKRLKGRRLSKDGAINVVFVAMSIWVDEHAIKISENQMINLKSLDMQPWSSRDWYLTAWEVSRLILFLVSLWLLRNALLKDDARMIGGAI